MDIVLEDKIFATEKLPKKMNKIVIYCHGFGENRERIIQHYEVLNDNNIGIISFDFPCHGDDKSNCTEFNIENCTLYLNSVIDYAKKYNVPIVLMGSSFGGYIVLNRINKINEKFDKIFLKFPAINFYECMIRKLQIDIDYYNNYEYYEFSNRVKISKTTFLEIKNNNLMKSFNKHFNDIFIIHGDKDRTVLLKDVKSFCHKYNIKLSVIYGAEHGMKDYLDVVNDKLLSYIIK